MRVLVVVGLGLVQLRCFPRAMRAMRAMTQSGGPLALSQVSRASPSLSHSLKTSHVVL
jgi:hypothetical protein